MSLYTPILVLGAIAAVFAIVSVVIAVVVGPRRNNRAKLSAYECGVEPLVNDQVGQRFPIKYYLTAMLFIIFDVEVLFLYPFAVAFDKLGVWALVHMVLFIAIVSALLGCLAAASAWCGRGLLRHDERARVGAIALSLLQLAYVPLGTVAGAYALWVLMNDERTRAPRERAG